MQDAKDTFYEVMRGRLAGVNPERTVVVRGVVRPGVVVEENELVSAEAAPADCFRLRWVGAMVSMQGAMPVETLTCEVSYETAGTAMNAGMDRGRALGAMDAELVSMVNAAPQNAVKTSYAGLAQGKAAVMLGTNIWWGDVALGPVVVKGERVGRTATLAVMSYGEAGEL